MIMICQPCTSLVQALARARAVIDFQGKECRVGKIDGQAYLIYLK